MIYTASNTAALLAVEQLRQPVMGQDLPADLRPVLVIQWDPTRPWHHRHSAGQHQVPALGPLFFFFWGGPSPRCSLVRWHCGPQVLGRLQRACT